MCGECPTHFIKNNDIDEEMKKFTQGFSYKAPKDYNLSEMMDIEKNQSSEVFDIQKKDQFK